MSCYLSLGHEIMREYIFLLSFRQTSPIILSVWITCTVLYIQLYIRYWPVVKFSVMNSEQPNPYNAEYIYNTFYTQHTDLLYISVLSSVQSSPNMLRSIQYTDLLYISVLSSVQSSPNMLRSIQYTDLLYISVLSSVQSSPNMLRSTYPLIPLISSLSLA